MMSALLQTTGVAAQLRCSVRTVRRLVAAGSLKPIRVRGMLRFEATEIAKLIEAGRSR